MSLSEVAIFKQCVTDPITLDPSLSELNLASISDPEDKQGLSEQQLVQRRAQKMFYMVWSGVTKYIRETVINQQKAIEIPRIGIFCMQHDKPQQKLTKQALEKMEMSNVLVGFDMQQQFLDLFGEGSSFVDKGCLISVYDPLKDGPAAARVPGLASLNFGSIAHVCGTDERTVNLVLNEIVSKLGQLGSKGHHLRVNFRVGYLCARGSLIHWRQYADKARRRILSNERDEFEQSELASTTRGSVVGSMHRKQLSVRTPTYRSMGKAFSQRGSDRLSYHVSNPNPQRAGPRFYGVKEGSIRGVGNKEGGCDPNDIIRFGKRVAFGARETNQDVLEFHLKQMKDKLESQRLETLAKKNEEKEHIKRLIVEQTQQEELKRQSVNEQTNLMMSYNDLKKADNQISTAMDRQQRNHERFNFFPFISSDVIEQHRQNLGKQLKTDLQSYLEHTKYTPNKGSKDWDNQSVQKSLVGSMGHTSGNSAYIKSLFDSDYIPPQNNEKVLQDSHPLKSAALQAAVQRYQNQIKLENDAKEKFKQDHHFKIEQDQKNFENDQKRRKDEKHQVNEELKQQIENNMRASNENNKVLKGNIHTHYGPEESENDLRILNERKRKQQQDIKEMLEKQMGEKEVLRRSMKDAQLSWDNLQIQQATDKLAQEKERFKIKKEELKNHWQEQIQKNNEFNEKKNVLAQYS